VLQYGTCIASLASTWSTTVVPEVAVAVHAEVGRRSRYKAASQVALQLVADCPTAVAEPAAATKGVLMYSMLW
jgi:hypothetical protein